MLYLLLMLGIPASISTFFQAKCKKLRGILQILRVYMFYLICFCLVICFAKTAIGYLKYGFLESFSGISTHTLRIYLPILVVASLLISWIVNKIIKLENLERKQYIFCSNFLTMSCICSVCFYHVTISEMFILALLSLVTTWGEEKWFGDKIKVDKVAQSPKKQIIFGLPICLFMVVTGVLYIPATLFLQNAAQIGMPLLFFFSVMIVACVLVVLVFISFFLFFMTKLDSIICIIVLWTVTLGGYIQSNFLNGRMMQMNASLQKWTVSSQVLSICIWTILIGINVFVFYKYFEVGKKISIFLSYSFVFMQITSLVVLLLSYRDDIGTTYTLTTEHLFEMNQENNVVLFVLDWFDEQIMEDIYEDSPEYLEPLQDFTWYQNVSSMYAFTDLSMPFLLSGVEKPKDIYAEEYYDYAYEHTDFWNKVKKSGFETSIGTYKGYITPGLSEYISNYGEKTKGGYYKWKTYLLMTKAARYSMAPFALKNLFLYFTTDFVLLNSVEKISNEYISNNDYYFNRQINSIGLSLSQDTNAKGSYKIYHLNGPHYPFITDENVNFYDSDEEGNIYAQAKGSLKCVYTVLQQMKDLGIYDNASIFITADHGQNSDDNFQPPSNPILFAKYANDEGRTQMRINTAPLTHKELFDTIQNAIVNQDAIEGRALESIPEGTERTRKLIFGRDYDIPYVIYEINGDVREKNNWKRIKYE